MTGQGGSSEFKLNRRQQQHGVPETWAVSYGDLITQLLVFFVVLVSSSSVNESKLKRIQQSIKGEAANAPSITQMTKDLSDTLAKYGLSDYVNVAIDGDGIIMVIKDSLLFHSGEAVISDDSRRKLEPIVSAFVDLPKLYNFSIEGHTDDVPIHTPVFASNWHLSAARALAVLTLFQNHNFSEDRLSVRAFGDQKPMVPNRDAGGQPIDANRQINRRVVIRIK